MAWEELNHYFTSWEHSLLQLGKERIGKLRIRGKDKVDYLEEKNFEAATILLKKEDEGRIPAYFSEVLEKDPVNIHAWCIKGMHHLRSRPAELREAQEARKKMEELMNKEGPMNEAKVEKAYWLHQRDGSEEAKEKAYELFDSIDHFTVSQNALYLQVLAADLKRVREVTEQIKRRFQKLINISADILRSDDDQHILGVWSGLIDVLCNTNCSRLLKIGQVDDSEIVNLMEGNERMTVSFCGKKLLSMEDNPNIRRRSSFYARVAKILRNEACYEENVEERETLLYLGLEFAEKYKNVQASSLEHAPRLCAQILLGIWAIKYLETNRDLVETDYNEKRYSPQGSPIGLWKHASRFYYSTTPDTSPATNYLLEEAWKHLKEYNIPNRYLFVPEYARVLMLLGRPAECIEQALTQMTGGPLSQAEGSVLAHQGLFYEAVGDVDSAVNFYRQATQVGNQEIELIKIAGKRLERIRRGC